ncbi:MAG: TRAP transporter TatT component family protein [Exilispira sp.]
MKNFFKYFLPILLIALLIFFSFDDTPWKNRNSAEGAKAAYEYYKKLYKENPNSYEAAWKYARAIHFYTNEFINDNKIKKENFTEGKNVAENATKLNPNGVEGYYYFAVCLGSWGEVNGILASLSSVGPMEKAATKAAEIDPSFNKGAPYMLLGRLYQKVPGKSKTKCKEYYELSLKYGPTGRVNYRFYAEFLIEQKDYVKAREIIQRGLAIPFDEEDRLIEEKEIKILKELLESIKNK